MWTSHPQCQVFVAGLVNILALALQPGRFRICLTLPVLGYLMTQTPAYNGDEFGPKWMVNVWKIFLAFVYVDWIFLESPDREHWQRLNENVKGQSSHQKAVTTPQSFHLRFWWALRLQCALRYVGWSSQVKNVPASVPAGYPRWKFIIRKSLRFLLMALITDTICSYTASTQHGSFSDIYQGEKIPGLGSVSLGRSFILCWAMTFLVYSRLESLNCAFSVIFVLLGFHPPHECPPLFGDLRRMYTVRNAWSSVWHQMMRRVNTSIGVYIARDVCGFRKGTFGSKYLQLFIGFLISAIIHGCGAMMTYHSWKSNWEFTTYMAQAVAIMVEDHVVDLGRCLGLRSSYFWHFVGYLWTISWFGLSFQAHTSAVLEEGAWIHERGLDVFRIGPAKN